MKYYFRTEQQRKIYVTKKENLWFKNDTNHKETLKKGRMILNLIGFDLQQSLLPLYPITTTTLTTNLFIRTDPDPLRPGVDYLEHDNVAYYTPNNLPTNPVLSNLPINPVLGNLPINHVASNLSSNQIGDPSAVSDLKSAVAGPSGCSVQVAPKINDLATEHAGPSNVSNKSPPSDQPIALAIFNPKKDDPTEFIDRFEQLYHELKPSDRWSKLLGCLTGKAKKFVKKTMCTSNIRWYSFVEKFLERYGQKYENLVENLENKMFDSTGEFVLNW